MMYEGKPVVIIGGFDSSCSVCGGNADPWEWSHVSGGPNGMYSPGSALSDKNGCGVKWEDKVSEYINMDVSRFKVPHNKQLELGLDSEPADDVE